jgi:hypothetical protein
MKPEPKLDRYKRPELQEAYESGFAQEYDHDSFTLLDRFSHLLDEAPSSAEGAERMAAMLEGAADPLHGLARTRRNDLPSLRALDDAGF